MSERFQLFSFHGRMRILHLTWLAFFISFFVWFNHAPLMASIREDFGLTPQQVKTLLILNVAMTIPARIVIGMLVDHFGPRRIYSSLLILSSFFCFAFALARSYEQLALTRFLLGFVGAGFVIGIRMISEWFPAREVGLAEGIYGGWGNFGSAAAAMTLPSLALLYGGEAGWRYAIATTGVIALVYGMIYFFSVSDTPRGSTYFRPKKAGAMEVSSVGDFFFYVLMNLPLYLALGLLIWKLTHLGLFTVMTANVLYIVLSLMYTYQIYHAVRVNHRVFREPVPPLDRYKFKQVAILNLAYFISFGSELAVVSMLPLFFKDTFGVNQVLAGMLASGFAFMNLVARPSGGLISDNFSRKHTLLVLLGGLGLGYLAMSQIDASWPLWLAVAATMACSFFVQATEGAVFALVPLIKRRLTGQIAGLTGAYGNVGAVTFLTAYSFTEAHTFFLIIATAALAGMAASLFLEEPKGHMAETLPDGTVQMIEVE
ncbi:MFS transporter, NNP family, nitrate/nitrite transporter [Methylomarinovum tepidoasis]|uniref:Nitrate/nitrite transporter n=1 Tax=Methylomarinovum tepidoasis TaxID=2840183 RepID=A0AAU9CVC7_9GAMM|nr:NarK family nitrate/nitrite MFS transporter [Methylomarinovum sp. IN45]BCX88049.1 MFS transporter, NNP family, nitrate/nitrite transporter [Methylomarinovum sp. IN45]